MLASLRRTCGSCWRPTYCSQSTPMTQVPDALAGKHSCRCHCCHAVTRCVLMVCCWPSTAVQPGCRHRHWPMRAAAARSALCPHVFNHTHGIPTTLQLILEATSTQTMNILLGSPAWAPDGWRTLPAPASGRHSCQSSVGQQGAKQWKQCWQPGSEERCEPNSDS